MNAGKSCFRERIVDRGGWVSLVMRIGFAWVKWSMLPELVPFVAQPVPNGHGLVRCEIRRARLASLTVYLIGCYRDVGRLLETREWHVDRSLAVFQ